MIGNILIWGHMGNTLFWGCMGIYYIGVMWGEWKGKWTLLFRV